MNGDQIENKPNMQEHIERLPQSRDHRAHVRRAPESLTYVALGEANGGIVGNISENGLTTTAAEMLVAEILSCIRFWLPDSARCIETSARIVLVVSVAEGRGRRVCRSVRRRPQSITEMDFVGRIAQRIT